MGGDGVWGWGILKLLRQAKRPAPNSHQRFKIMSRFIFQIADASKTPGSYSVVDGVWLVDESMSELFSGENFQDVVSELKAEWGNDCKFALVEGETDGEFTQVLEIA